MKCKLEELPLEKFGVHIKNNFFNQFVSPLEDKIIHGFSMFSLIFDLAKFFYDCKSLIIFSTNALLCLKWKVEKRLPLTVLAQSQCFPYRVHLRLTSKDIFAYVLVFFVYRMS